jgi:protein gp37
MNNRFKWIEDFSEPQFFPERLNALKSKKPKSIFMDSMSDIEFWTDEQMGAVICAIKAHKYHKYIFLTKADMVPYDLFFYHSFEQRNEEKGAFRKKTADAIEGQNVYLGKTITNQVDISFTDYSNFDFWSIEPIRGRIVIDKAPFERLNQVIIGAETGNRKGKIIPRKEWIDDIVKQCGERKIRVFMKESLKKLMGVDFRQDPLIWEVGK